VTKVAVVAHAGKTMGGGLPQLRKVLQDAGYPSPAWFEVFKSKQAPACARQAVAEGADVLFVWGGDGTVQRCVDAVAGEGSTALAVIPAGTANLLARNLGIPRDIAEAVRIGLHGDRQALDTGTVNGEHFAVMAGAGLDALMISDADAGLKDRMGRAAYLWTGARNLDASPVKATVEVEGRRFFKGTITCVLAGNMGQVLGGVEVFGGSRPDDGLLEVGVVTARSRTQWIRTLARVVVGTSEESPFVAVARGTSIKVSFDKPTPIELDGGVRKAVSTMRIKVRPGSVTICVPPGGPLAESPADPGEVPAQQA
jgi:YegS/Rv2252/BmrU family lipid kinase